MRSKINNYMAIGNIKTLCICSNSKGGIVFSQMKFLRIKLKVIVF